MALEAGIAAERTYTVTYEVTAAALGESDGADGVILPAVWSTPDMIARMEMVSATLAAAHLDDSQMTVGSRNEITHLAPTPVGAQVRVCSELVAVEGRKLTFNVSAFDAQEKAGEGIHVRYVVDRAKFEARLRAKMV